MISSSPRVGGSEEARGVAAAVEGEAPPKRGVRTVDFGIAVATGADSWKVAQRAEDLGFSHVWFYDSQMLCADCFVAMGAAAVKTSRRTTPV